MKLSTILLLACLQVSAGGYTQTVTLSERNASLPAVFKKIEKQTGYQFFYNERLLLKAKKVNIDVREALLQHVLEACFRNQPFTYEMIGKTIVIKKEDPALQTGSPGIPGEAPPITVHGRVVNDKGEPVEGITVTIKGTKRAVFTNANGEFTFTNISPNATLLFTGVNVEDYELKVNGKTDLSVPLKKRVASIEGLTITANTGYQTITRERSTGAYDVVGRDVLDKRPVSDVSTALQGMVAGLQGKENLDGTMKFLIRGTSSIYAATQPLIVVDGFPIEGSDFSNINPNDVESITVLKDAAAASIWGARSANGVIVIVTKRPRGQNRTMVEMNAFTRVYNMIDLNQVTDQANSADQVKYEQLAWNRNIGAKPYANSFATTYGYPLTLAQEMLYANYFGTMTTAQVNAGLDSLSKINNRQQIRDLLLRHGLVNQFTVNFQTASDRSKTYGSLLYEKREEGFVKTGYDRYLMNFSNQYQATSFLQFSFGANLQYKKQQSSGANVSEIDNLSPYETLLNPDGSYSVNLMQLNRQQLALLPLNKFPYSDWSYNLLREVNGRNISNVQTSARLQAGVNIKLWKGLTYDVKAQYERNETNASNYESDQTFFTRNLVNTFVSYNNTTRTVGTQYIPVGGILETSSTTLESYDVRNQLNYNQAFGKKVLVTAIAGSEVSSYLTNSQVNPWVFGYYPDKNQSSLPPYGYGSAVSQLQTFTGTANTISGYTGSNNAGGNTTFGWRKDKYVSFYGNAAMTYDLKYTLSGSIRSDASNYITTDPKLRWSPFWSVGGMWNMKREDFMRDVSFVDRLALRLTYGRNGNTVTSTSTEPLLSIGTNPSTSTNTITATISNYGNPYLSWEKTSTTELGADFGLFKNILSGKIDLYNKVGKNIVGTVVLPAASGTTSQQFNNTEIINRGIEIELGANIRNIGGSRVSYHTSLTYAYNRNRVSKINYPSYTASTLTGGISDNAGNTIAAPVKGKPMGALWSYTFAGMIDSVPYAKGPKGVPYTFNTTALTFLASAPAFMNYEGTTVQPHTLGWVNEFSAYGLDLMVLVTGKFGGVFRDPVFNYQSAADGSAKTFVNRYVADVFAGRTDIPSFPKTNETQYYLWDRYAPYLSSLVESASYVECKEIDLGYTFPAKVARRAAMSSLRVFAQARDLGLIWRANKHGYDPDWMPGTFRPVTSWLAGINIKF